MRKLITVSIVIVLSILITSCSKKMPVDTGLPLSLQGSKPLSSVQSVRDYTYDYNQVVLSPAYEDVYVICDDCTRTSKLERELADVPIAVWWGKETVASVLYKPRTERQIISPAPALKLDQMQTPQAESDETARETMKVGNPETAKASNTAPEDKTHKKDITSCLNTPIQFDFDSAVLKDREKIRILASLEQLKKVKDIEVKGYTCDIGTKDYNDKLALKRAEVVATYLKVHGLKISQVTGEGNCCYISQENKMNRRVEINCLQ